MIFINTFARIPGQYDGLLFQQGFSKLVINENPELSRSLEFQIGFAIRDIGIPPRPAILDRIDQEILKDDPDFTQLARILTADVALAAALLQTTNSAFFGFDKKVRSVQEAVLVLGLNLVMRTVAAISLRSAFGHLPEMERFWDASATTARLCGWLATRLRKHCRVRPEDAYTFGLFHDCGVPVLMNPFPEYRQVLAQANAETTLSFTEVENQLISVNHADMGALLASSWLLPDEIVLAIRHHHDLVTLTRQLPPECPDIVLPLVAIVQLAEHLIYVRTGLSRSHEWEKITDVAMGILGLDENSLAVLREECEEALADEAD